MAITSVKISAQHRISIPRQARNQLKIRGGDHLLVDVQDGMILLLPEPRNYTQLLAGLHREIWGKSDELIVGERDAWMDFSK